ncbi:MAG: ferredoxin [Actinomycetia bacterium]|nr:ferredoxin [Actinomycetes bacterium]
MRIDVDRVLCQGHGVCESEAPAVFEVGSFQGQHNQVVVLDEAPGDELRDSVELAVKYCPTHALKIVED